MESGIDRIDVVDWIHWLGVEHRIGRFRWFAVFHWLRAVGRVDAVLLLDWLDDVACEQWRRYGLWRTSRSPADVADRNCCSGRLSGGSYYGSSVRPGLAGVGSRCRTGNLEVTLAPVAQGIERWPPEPCAQVRILPGAHFSITITSE